MTLYELIHDILVRPSWNNLWCANYSSVRTNTRFTVKSVGLTGPLLEWFQNYLSGRKQRVVLPGGASYWVNITAGMPQGSILGPILYLIYINDIVKDIQSTICLFADYISLYIIVDSPDNASNTLNQDLAKISSWADRCLVLFNPKKTESILLSHKVKQPVHPPLIMNNETLTMLKVINI